MYADGRGWNHRPCNKSLKEYFRGGSLRPPEKVVCYKQLHFHRIYKYNIILSPNSKDKT